MNGVLAKLDLNFRINPLNAELNPICHLLALIGGATIVVISRLRVNIITSVIVVAAVNIIAAVNIVTAVNIIPAVNIFPAVNVSPAVDNSYCF